MKSLQEDETVEDYVLRNNIGDGLRRLLFLHRLGEGSQYTGEELQTLKAV
jgi:hypothetical protein